MKKQGENIINVLDTFVKNTESLNCTRDVLGNKNQDCSMGDILQHLVNPKEDIDGPALGLVLKARANLSRLIFMETLLKNDIGSAKELDSSLNTLQNILLEKGQTIKSEDFLYIMKNAHLYYLDGIIGNIGNEFKLTFSQAQEIFENEKIIPNSDFPKDHFTYQCTDKILYLKQKGNLSNLKPEELNDLGYIGKEHINDEKSDSEGWCKAYSGLTGIYALMFLFASVMAVSTGSHVVLWVSVSVFFAACAMITASEAKYDYANCKLGEYKLNAFKIALPFDVELRLESCLKALSNPVSANELGGERSVKQLVNGNDSSSNKVVEPSQGGDSSMTLNGLDN